VRTLSAKRRGRRARGAAGSALDLPFTLWQVLQKARAAGPVTLSGFWRHAAAQPFNWRGSFAQVRLDLAWSERAPQ
jgi:hypothetical protein